MSSDWTDEVDVVDVVSINSFYGCDSLLKETFSPLTPKPPTTVLKL